MHVTFDINVRGTRLTFIPSKYTRYTVYLHRQGVIQQGGKGALAQPPPPP